MQITQLTTASVTLTTDTTILDRGEVISCDISVSPGVSLHYVFVGDNDNAYTREFHLAEGAQFQGGVVIYGMASSYQAVTHIEGDSVNAHLRILGLARDNALLDIRGSSVVDSPYRQIHTRVDQNNIFLGKGGSIRGMPVLEIATDDVEGGHSCRIHRVAGEALFYLQSHGLDTTTAEGLLIEAELRKHTSIVGDCEVCDGLIGEIQDSVFAK